MSKFSHLFYFRNGGKAHFCILPFSNISIVMFSILSGYDLIAFDNYHKALNLPPQVFLVNIPLESSAEVKFLFYTSLHVILHNIIGSGLERG